MKYFVRSTQKFRPENAEAFFLLEDQFILLEQSRPDLAQGSRRVPFAGDMATSALIWECSFDSLEDLQAGLKKMNADAGHDRLYRQQVPLITEAFLSIEQSYESHKETVS